MSGYAYGPECVYAMQTLARHQMIRRLLADMLADMQVCRLEGWDVREFPRMVGDAIEGLYDKEDQG